MKYRKCKKEYQHRLNEAGGDAGKVNKSKIAKKYNVSPQQLNYWVKTYNWDDLTDYVNVPGILKDKAEIKKRSNSPYGPEMLEELFKLAKMKSEDGQALFNKKQLAEKLGISEATFHRYMNDKIDFLKTYMKARDVVLLERSLMKRALGTGVAEQKVEDVFAYGKKVGVKETVVQKQVPGDVNAIRYALNNKDPENYKEKQDVNVKANVSVDIGDFDLGDVVDELDE